MKPDIYREKIIKIIFKKDTFKVEYISNNYDIVSVEENDRTILISIKNGIKRYIKPIKQHIAKKNVDYEVEICCYYIKKRVSLDKELEYINTYIFIVGENINISIDFQTNLKEIYDVNKIIDSLQCKMNEYERINQVPKYKGGYIGKRKVIFSGEATGAIIHETIGHTLEDKCSIRSWKQGDMIFNIGINIIDDPTINNFVGSYPVDDKGEMSKKKYLVEEGKINEILCSKENCLNNNYGGNARCENYLHNPRARMSNTYLEEYKDKDIFENLDSYVYVYQIIVGGVNYELEQVNLLGRAILVNKEAYNLGKVFICEDISVFLKKLEKVGTDISFASSCWCFKESDVPLPGKR